MARPIPFVPPVTIAALPLLALALTACGSDSKDDGGTTNGGMDTSPAQTFTITLTPVNDVPSFTIISCAAAIVRASDNDQLAEIVTEHIRALPGITSSETLIAFRVYSRHDLERMFSIGLEKA